MKDAKYAKMGKMFLDVFMVIVLYIGDNRDGI